MVDSMAQENKRSKFGGFLSFEAILKSTLVGVAVGGTAAFLLALVGWFLEFNMLIISVVAFLLIGAGVGYFAYIRLFFPSASANARRLDRYGLDERLITMVELEGDDSYIARRQREDAVASLESLDTKRVKLKIPAVIITLAIIFGALFLGMNVVEGLSSADIIPTGSEVWVALFPPPPPESFSVKYQVATGGVIHGNPIQSVYEGENSEPVLAVADDGFMFIGWSDGRSNPSRFDENITKDITITAVFIEVTADRSFGDDEGDEPDDVPGENEVSMPSNEPNAEGDPLKYVEVNQVIDGKTYYRDIFEDYYAEMVERLENGEEIPEEIREIIEAYFNIIQ